MCLKDLTDTSAMLKVSSEGTTQVSLETKQSPLMCNGAKTLQLTQPFFTVFLRLLSLGKLFNNIFFKEEFQILQCFTSIVVLLPHHRPSWG